MRPRALISEDRRLFPEDLKRIVEAEYETVQTARSGHELVALVNELRPELVLLDVTMPLLNGIEAARQMKPRNPDTKIIFVTARGDRDYIREAFTAGASGYVLKQAAESELRTAIQEVQQGRFFLSPALSEGLMDAPSRAGEHSSKLFGLTPRQREVLQLVAEGKSESEIAALLFISVKTVEFHQKDLMEELNLSSSAELARYAVEQGWVAS